MPEFLYGENKGKKGTGRADNDIKETGTISVQADLRKRTRHFSLAAYGHGTFYFPKLYALNLRKLAHDYLEVHPRIAVLCPSASPHFLSKNRPLTGTTGQSIPFPGEFAGGIFQSLLPGSWLVWRRKNRAGRLVAVPGLRR